MDLKPLQISFSLQNFIILSVQNVKEIWATLDHKSKLLQGEETLLLTHWRYIPFAIT